MDKDLKEHDNIRHTRMFELQDLCIMYKGIITGNFMLMITASVRDLLVKLFSVSALLRGFQMAAISLTGPELQLLRDNSQREEAG